MKYLIAYDPVTNDNYVVVMDGLYDFLVKIISEDPLVTELIDNFQSRLPYGNKEKLQAMINEAAQFYLKNKNKL